MILTETGLDFFLQTRAHSENICKPLEIEDYVVQPIEDVSPPKWHLGHTTWFFEEFLLKPYLKDYNEFSPDFSFVFNSYYETVGKRVVRAERGNLSRPSVQMVYDYRRYVTNAVKTLFLDEEGNNEKLLTLLEIGIHHEKQHQELLLTDIKYILGNNPLLPVYSTSFEEHPPEDGKGWEALDEGLYEIGHTGEGFCYDNECRRHKVYLNPFEIRKSLVTNAEYIEFISEGGYDNFEYWHAEGWEWACALINKNPLYWHNIEGKWHHYTLNGLREIAPDGPVTHLSYYEAFAFAQWKGCRLPTEFEWEAAQQYFAWGTRWEWTESAYLPYPGYTKAEGALGEYNGKFMVNQKVLRGASVATPINHSRPSYRNFFHPGLRWQYTGLRLAR